MDPSLLATIEFQKEIGQFSEVDRRALVMQLVLAAKSIQRGGWETIDKAELFAPTNAPEGAEVLDEPRVIIPGG